MSRRRLGFTGFAAATLLLATACSDHHTILDPPEASHSLLEAASDSVEGDILVGPVTLERENGKPTAFAFQYVVPHVERYQGYWLVVRSANESGSPAAARVYFDGDQVLGEPDFSARGVEYSIPVQALASGEVNGVLFGAPGSGLEITLIGEPKPFICRGVEAGFGTAMIDGMLGVAEWAPAGRVTFPARIPGNELVVGSLYYMADDETLYVAYQLPFSGPFMDSHVIFGLDSDQSWTLSHGDDGFGWSGAGYSDWVRWGEPPCPTGALCGFFDTKVGGTLDGSGEFSAAGGLHTFEFARPFNSGDPKDMLVAPPAALWMSFMAYIHTGEGPDGTGPVNNLLRKVCIQ